MADNSDTKLLSNGGMNLHVKNDKEEKLDKSCVEENKKKELNNLCVKENLNKFNDTLNILENKKEITKEKENIKWTIKEIRQRARARIRKRINFLKDKVDLYYDRLVLY